MDDHIAFATDLTGRSLDTDAEIADALRSDAPAWLHLAADHDDTPRWIDTHLSWLDPAIREALTAPETRPRALRIGEGVLLILRGINLNAGADPEDMVSLRLYVDPARIVSLSRRRLRSVDTIASDIGAGRGPDRAGALVARLVAELNDRIDAQVADLEARVDEAEVAVVAGSHPDTGAQIADQRLELTDLKRFLPPQRDAVRDLGRIDLAWLTEADRRRLVEEHDQLIRTVETLEAMREQLVTLAGELDAARDERLNRNLYVLSVISAIFLPLGFLTGLMGINIAGMPGTEWPPAFWTFAIGLAVFSVLILGWLKWKRIL